MKVKIKKERDNFKMPEKMTKGAGAFDVYCSKIEQKGDMVICYLGFSTEMPEFIQGFIIPRSSISKYNWVLANSIGLIDNDFRGEWQVRFKPLLQVKYFKLFGIKLFKQIAMPKFPYKVGDRVAQIYFQSADGCGVQEVEELSETNRDGAGFGTTGLK